MKRLIALLITGLFLGACSGDSKPNRTPEPTSATVPTATPLPCPVDRFLCEFAVELEGAARDGSLAQWSPTVAPELAQRALAMWAATGGKPRVTTIGCPGRGTTDCSKEFAVTLSSLPEGLEEQDGRGLEIFFFARNGDARPLARTIYEPPGGRSIVVSGGERAFCEPAIVPAGGCIDYRFEKFRTGAPEADPPVGGKLPPIRQVYGATSTVMTLGEPYSIQQGEVWYFKYLCDACGPGPLPNLYRAYRAADGTLVVDALKAKTAGLGTAIAFAANWQTGTVWIATCDGVCGPYEGGGSNVESTVYRSRDGGITWVESGTLPPQTRFVDSGFNDEVLAFTYGPSADQERYWLFPSGSDLAKPQGIDRATSYPEIINHWTILWHTQAGTFHDATGTALFGPLFDEKYKPQIAVADPQYQHTYLTWAETEFKVGWTEQPFYWYVARIDRDGQMRELFGLPGDTMWIGGEFPRTGDKPPALFGRFRFGASLDYVRDVSFGAVLDLTNGKVRRFAELDAARPPGSFVWMEDLMSSVQLEKSPGRAPFYRVTGAGDCLNIRESPSLTGRVIACLADDVLVGGMETPPQSADGIEWRYVSLPDKRSGWASTEFLR